MMDPKFKAWLKRNTDLSESTIRIYCNVASKFQRDVPEVKIDFINQWISDNSREKRNYHYKYALKLYLKFAGLASLEHKLVRQKVRPRSSIGHYYPPKKVLEIIGGLEFYRPVALIQFLGGARAREALSVEREKIVKLGDGVLVDKGLTMAVYGKGGKERWVKIPKPFSETIEAYMGLRKGKYPFLKGSNPDHLTWLNSNYRYYCLELKEATEKAGVKFSTHDFRRNFATLILDITKNPYAVKLALGHSEKTNTDAYFKPTLDEDIHEKFVERVLS